EVHARHREGGIEVRRGLVVSDREIGLPRLLRAEREQVVSGGVERVALDQAVGARGRLVHVAREEEQHAAQEARASVAVGRPLEQRKRLAIPLAPEQLERRARAVALAACSRRRRLGRLDFWHGAALAPAWLALPRLVSVRLAPPRLASARIVRPCLAPSRLAPQREQRRPSPRRWNERRGSTAHPSLPQLRTPSIEEGVARVAE